MFCHIFLILKTVREMFLWHRTFFSHSLGKSAGFEQWHSMIAPHAGTMQTSTGQTTNTHLHFSLPFYPALEFSSLQFDAVIVSLDHSPTKTVPVWSVSLHLWRFYIKSLLKIQCCLSARIINPWKNSGEKRFALPNNSYVEQILSRFLLQILQKQCITPKHFVSK